MLEILTKLKNEKNMFRRRLLLAGYLTEQLKDHGVFPIIVGGHAVEIYTFQDYTTHDLDLVLAERESISKALEQLGFQKISGARHWIQEDLDLALEIPDDTLAGDLDRLLKLEIDGFTIHVIGVEDLIIDRLNAFIHWKSLSDYEQALKIYLTHNDKIDQEYLEKQGDTNQVREGIKRLRKDYHQFIAASKQRKN